jgi:hypothetical protein
MGRQQKQVFPLVDFREQAAASRIEEQYQWHKIAGDIEKTYSRLMGWDFVNSVEAPTKGNARIVARERARWERKAG